MALAAGSRPVLGTTVQMTTSNIPAGSPAQALLYGPQATPAIDLTTIGMAGCFSHMTSFDVYSLVAAPAATVVTPVTVPNVPTLVGLTVALQSVSYSPPRTSFGWLSSNGIVMFLAAQ